jgi:hypothetical protein
VAEAADNTPWYIPGGIAQVGVTVNQLTIKDNRAGWQFKLGHSLTNIWRWKLVLLI